MVPGAVHRRDRQIQPQVELAVTGIAVDERELRPEDAERCRWERRAEVTERNLQRRGQRAIDLGVQHRGGDRQGDA